MKYLLSFFVFSTLFSFGQTCIILKQQHDSIFVGADTKSKIVVQYTDGTDTTFDKVVSKIHIVNNYNYAIAGSPDATIDSIARYFCNNGHNIDKIINQFSDSMKIKLHYLLELERQYRPDSYRKTYVGNFICSISFFGFEKDNPYIKTIHFIEYNKVTEPVIITAKIPTHSKTFEVLGIFTEIQKRLDKGFEIPFKSGVFNGIEYLIKEEMKSSPEHIGLPIELLLVTKNKRKWYRRI